MKLHLKSAAIGGTVAAVAVAGALIAGPVFADDSATTTAPGLSSGNVTDEHRGGRMGGFGGPMLHSEGVAASTDSSGTVTYVTVRNQLGQVTAASDSAITVKSDDGYTKTWAIGSTTIVVKDGSTVKASSFAVGDTVMVHGTVDGDTVTTTFVGGGMARGMGEGMGGRGHGRGGHMDGDGPMGGGDESAAGTLAPMPSTNTTSA